MVAKLLSFFLGFLFSSLLDTTISEFHEWSIVSAGFIVAFIEFVNKAYFYMSSKMIKSGLKKTKAQIFLNLINYLKMGLIYGLVVDSFKLGS
jgi:hypothetical protein